MLEGKESEVKLREQLAPSLCQLGSDRLGFLETWNIVATEASIAADEPFAGEQVLLVRIHGLELFAGFDVGGVRAQEFERDIVERGLIDFRQRLLFPVGIFQRGQVSGNIRGLVVGQPQTRHLRFGPHLRRILNPVVNPRLSDLASLVLQVEAVAASNLALVGDFLDRTDRVTAEAPGGFDNLQAAASVATSTTDTL